MAVKKHSLKSSPRLTVKIVELTKKSSPVENLQGMLRAVIVSTVTTVQQTPKDSNIKYEPKFL